MGWGGRQEGGSGWGTHVNPWLIHVNVWQKPLQYCKVISLQVIKINEKETKKQQQKNKTVDYKPKKKKKKNNKQQLDPEMEQQTGSKLAKEYIQAVYCHPAYLTYMQGTS